MELKNVKVYKEELWFPKSSEEKTLQEKFDLLFTTVKLMGYEIQDTFKISSENHNHSTYVIRVVDDFKHFLIEFNLMNFRVVDIYIVSPNGIRNLNLIHSNEGFINTDTILNKEEDLVTELDKLLNYI